MSLSMIALVLDRCVSDLKEEMRTYHKFVNMYDTNLPAVLCHMYLQPHNVILRRRIQSRRLCCASVTTTTIPKTSIMQWKPKKSL